MHVSSTVAVPVHEEWPTSSSCLCSAVMCGPLAAFSTSSAPCDIRYIPLRPLSVYLECDCGPLSKYCQCIIVSSSSDSDVGLFSQHSLRLIIMPSSRHQAGRAWSLRCAGGHTLPSPIICPTSCSIWLSRCLRQTRGTGRLCTPSWLLTGHPNSCVHICLPR